MLRFSVWAHESIHYNPFEQTAGCEIQAGQKTSRHYMSPIFKFAETLPHWRSTYMAQKKVERKKELDRRRKRRAERIKERIKEAKAAAKK